MAALVRYGQALSSFGTAGGKDFAAVRGGHSCLEAVLVPSLSIGGLVCSFHGFLFYYVR